MMMITMILFSGNPNISQGRPGTWADPPRLQTDYNLVSVIFGNKFTPPLKQFSRDPFPNTAQGSTNRPGRETIYIWLPTVESV